MTPDPLDHTYLFAPPSIALPSHLHSQCSGIIITLNTYPVFTHLDGIFFYTCVREKSIVFKVHLKSSPVLHPELPLFCLRPHSPVGAHMVLPLCSILNVVFICLPLPPSVSRVRQIPISQAYIPNAGMRSASEEVPSDVY